MPFEAGDQAAGKRVLLRVLRHGEASQVAHHRERVLIHGVDVKQIVLHLADDTPERRQVARQNVEHEHAPQRVHDALGLLKDLQEGLFVDWIAPEVGIDEVAGMPDCAQNTTRELIDVGVLRHDEKDAQQQRGLALEQVVAADIKPVLVAYEVLVNRERVFLVHRE